MSADVDPRGESIAVVADSLLTGLVLELGESGIGVMQLPPASLDGATARDWLEQTAEQVAEYLRSGYDVCAIRDGVWDDLLETALAKHGLARLPECSRPAHMSYTNG